MILNLYPRSHDKLVPQLMDTNHIKIIVKFYNTLRSGIIHDNNLPFKNILLINLAPGTCFYKFKLNGNKKYNKVL